MKNEMKFACGLVSLFLVSCANAMVTPIARPEPASFQAQGMDEQRRLDDEMRFQNQINQVEHRISELRAGRKELTGEEKNKSDELLRELDNQIERIKVKFGKIKMVSSAEYPGSRMDLEDSLDKLNRRIEEISSSKS